MIAAHDHACKRKGLLALEHRISVLGNSGDTPVIYAPDKPEEVKKAKEKFDWLAKQGFLLFDATVAPKEQIREFNPKLREIVAVPQFVGG